MIQLDASFQNVKAENIGQFENPPAGGYILKVIDVSDKKSESGSDMITLTLDIAEGPFEDGFGKYPKKVRQVISEKSLPYFKGMLNSFKASNPPEKLKGMVNASFQFNPMVLKGAIIGGLLRDAEYINKSGELKIGQEIDFLCQVDEVPNLKTRALKKLTGPMASGNTANTANNAPPHGDDDLPF